MSDFSAEAWHDSRFTNGKATRIVIAKLGMNAISFLPTHTKLNTDDLHALVGDFRRFFVAYVK